MNGDRSERPDPRKKFADARYETCKVCGREWNISTMTVIGCHGYTCPGCRDRRKKKGAKA